MRQALGLFLHHTFPFLLLETGISSQDPRYGNKEVLSVHCPLYNNGDTAVICTNQAFPNGAFATATRPAILSPSSLSMTGMIASSAVSTWFTIVSQDGDQIHA